MKIPSLRTQFILLSILLILFTSIIYRIFIIESVNELDVKLKKLTTSIELRNYILKYTSILPDSITKKLQNDGRKILDIEKQRGLAITFFKRDIARYSGYILFFIVFMFGGFSFFVITMITQPLNELMNATQRLANGETKFTLKSYSLSPIQPLIKSFNHMIKEIELSKIKLIKAEKELLWKEMAKALAHEIKNPLTPIQLTLDRMKNKFDDKPNNILDIFLPSYSVIKDEILNLNKLANEFSQFDRLPQSNFKQTDIIELISDITKGYYAQLNFNIITLKQMKNLKLDSLQMRQVFTNLFKNAIEAEAENIDIKIINTSKGVNLSIIDDGIGIDIEHQKSIFEPYFTLKKQGTGLGLAIIKQIINQHNAQISFDSKIGGGTSFHILFKSGK
jgi:two-component system, NtrC family, nitrogen regulation sensor histidine kinase NtrY